MDTVTKQDSVTKSAQSRDAVSPLPWRLVVNPLNGHLLIKESGPGVSLTVGNMFKPADAEFVVEAVNERESLIQELDVTRKELRIAVHRDEQAGKACRKWGEEYRAIFEERDRLRDLVRRLVHQFEGRATYDDEAAIIREAREAAGEDAE